MYLGNIHKRLKRTPTLKHQLHHIHNQTRCVHHQLYQLEWGQEFTADFNQSIFTSLGLSMLEIPFLPDWNAVINGCMNNDGHSSL